MKDHQTDTMRLTGVGVPRSLVATLDRFGGAPHRDLLIGTLVVQNGQVVGLEADPDLKTPHQIVLPKLTEAHIHLDKCFTIDRLDFDGGDLEAAGQAQWHDKSRWTADDLSNRALEGIGELAAAGVGQARSHIDWGASTGAPDAPLAWGVVADLRNQAKDAGITLELAALTGITEMADPDYAAAVARQVSQSGGVLGAFIKTHSQRQEGLKNIFRLAADLGLALDFHVDEGLDPTLDGLELIADVALDTGHPGPILCGHACALASYPLADVNRIADKLNRAGISIVSLPTTNLYLQGRVAQGTPDRRGLTRIHELQAAGVNVVIGTDNVCDAYCPTGRHDPMYSLSVAVLAGHLDPLYGPHLPMITTGAQKALGAAPTYIDQARIDDLLIYQTNSLARLIAGPIAPLSLTTRLDTSHA